MNFCNLIPAPHSSWKNTSKEHRLLNFAQEKFTSLSKHAENNLDNFPDDLKAFFTNLESQDGFEELTASFAQTEGEINEEQLKRYLEDEDPPSTAGDTLWQLFEDIPDPTKAEAADQKIQVILSYLRDRKSVLQQTTESLSQVKPERDEHLFHYTNKLLETTGAKPVFKNLVEGVKNASGKEKAILLAGIAIITIMLLKNKKTKKVLGWTLGIGAIALASDVAIRVAQRARFPDDKSWKKYYSEDNIDQVYEAMREGNVNVPNEFLSRIGGNEKKFVYPVCNLATLNSEEFENLYLTYEADGAIPTGSDLYPATVFSIEDERIAGITDAQRFQAIREMAEALGYLDGGEFEIPGEKYNQSILYQILNWGA